jgi:hypothetical protein
LRRTALIAFAAAALAQAPARADPPDAPRKTVSEVVVTATNTVEELVVTAVAKCPTDHGLNLDLPRRPQIVSTFPAEGQMVRPGLVVMRVTFDRPVACAGGFWDDPPLANPCPDRVQHMVLSFDRRTVRTVCLLDPEKLYGVRLNQSPGSAFRTVDGGVAEPFGVKFSTSLEAPVTDVCEAVRQDVEMLAELEKVHAVTCIQRDDPQIAAVKAEVERRDAEARTARDRAIAEAEAQRAKAAAHDLAKAETLAMSAYRKARDREWERLRAEGRQPAPTEAPADNEAPLVPGLTGLASPGRTQSRFNPRPGDADIIKPPVPGGGGSSTAEARPELTGWRQSFVVNGSSFDCSFEQSAVVCRRQ